MSTVNTQIWVWRETGALETTSIDGFRVEAVDGSIGKVDEATYDVGSSYIVVDTGPWIFGKKVLLPAGTVERIDTANEMVYVALARDQIKNTPEFDESPYRDESYRTSLGSYYGRDLR